MGIGDEIMAAGRAHELVKANAARKVAILDAQGRRRWHAIWERCPWVAREGEEAGASLMDGPNARPYIAARSRAKWQWRCSPPHRCPIQLTIGELDWASEYRDAVVIAPHIKPSASPNKRWPLKSWQQLTDIFRANNCRVVQMNDSAMAQPVPGAEQVVPPNIWYAAALIKVCRVAIVHEGALHHAAAAVDAKSVVVIVGGYIGSDQTGGYPNQVWLGTKNLGCGNRLHCSHCDAAMKAIEPQKVFDVALSVSRDNGEAQPFQLRHA